MQGVEFSEVGKGNVKPVLIGPLLGESVAEGNVLSGVACHRGGEQTRAQLR